MLESFESVLYSNNKFGELNLDFETVSWALAEDLGLHRRTYLALKVINTILK